jgi:hypothetical protein
MYATFTLISHRSTDRLEHGVHGTKALGGRNGLALCFDGTTVKGMACC